MQMKHIWGTLLCLGALVCALQGAELSYTYTFSAPTLAGQAQHADPGFKKLNSRRQETPVIWRYRDNQKKPVVLTCSFEPGSRLNEMSLSYFRPHAVRKHTINYGIKNIKVIGITVDGKKIPIGGAVLNQPYAKPAGEPEKGEVKITLEKIPLVSAEVHFTGNNGRLALYALAFNGEKAKRLPAAAGTSPRANPWQKEIDKAGNKLNIRSEGENFFLENAHVIYAVSPEAGGTVVMAYDRNRKVNLIRQGISGNDWGPFFQDRFYPGGAQARDSFRNSRFQAETPERTENEVVLRLRGRGKKGHFTGVLIEKKFILSADSPVLKVEYAIGNMPENVVPLHAGFWCSGGVESANGYKMIVPEKRAVSESGFFPGYREFADISGNWCAVRTPEDNGLAFLMPGDLLKSICFWTSGIHRGTMECKFGVYGIKAGESLRFSTALVPFGGIGKPLQVSETAAGSIRDGKVLIQFFRQGDYKLELFSGRISGNAVQWKLIQSSDIKTSGKYFSTSLPSGKHDAFLVLLKKQNKMVLRLEKAAPGKSFLLSTAGPKRKESSGGGGGGIELNFNSTSVSGDFWNWAVPLAGKAPRVLGINYRAGGIRDMVELGQRFGIKFDTHYIAGRWSLTGHQDLTEAQCVKELEQKLNKNYNAIMITGNVWKKFNPAVIKKLLQKVRSGTGLILFAPEGLPGELVPLCRKRGDKKSLPRSQWRLTGKESFLAGLPFEAFPSTAVTPYAIAGKTLIQAGGLPLLSSFTLGKGRVLVFTWPVADNASKLNRGGFFLPRMENISPLPEWAYYEYQIALLARCVCFAAARQSDIIQGEIRITAPGRAEAVIESRKAQKVKLLYNVRDRFSKLTASLSKELQLTAGKNLIQLPFTVPDMGGKYFINVKINSDKGTLWWGGVTGKNILSSEILSLKMEEKVYSPAGILTGSVSSRGKGTLRIEAFDNKGNCFWQGTSAAFSIPLKNCTTPSGKIRAELFEKNKCIDRKEKRFTLFFTPDPLDFNIAFGWPSLSIRAHIFNYSVFMKQMEKFGITCLNGDRYALDLPVAEAALRDFGWPQFSTQTNGFLGTKKPYNRNLVPKHKFELVRTPCLSKPEFRKKLAADSAALYPNYRYGALMVAGPDESNMFAQWDGCFTVECRHAFRNWLKKEYGTLAALNRSWQTQFVKWEDVVAMTLSEIRRRSSFAPWVDHRSFNDWNRAEALKELSAGIRKTAPIGYSFSGTQETNPFNAWDWYLMMPHLGGVSSYYGEQTVQHRSFAAGKFYQMPWIGYDSPYKRMNRQLWTALMNGGTGVNLYGATFYIQPDFTLSPTAGDLIRVLERYRNGAAQTLQMAELPDSPVAVHYTPASLKVNEVLELTAVRSSAVAGIRTLLNEKNLTYRYLAYGELVRQQFRGVKVLLLPLSSALSQAEVRGLELFVEKGGVLIADMLTGHYDQHGAPADTRAVRNLFGIAKSGKLERNSGTVAFNGAKIKVLSFEKGIVPASGVSVLGKNPDGTPAVLVNRRGKGMTVYFGSSLLSAYGDLQEIRYSKANSNVMTQMLKLFTGALEHGKVKVPFSIPGMQSTEVLLRKQGDMLFAGVGRNYEETDNAGLKKERRKVLLDKEYHIYDLFRQKYLGHGRTFEYEFAADAQEIFALLPYRIADVKTRMFKKGEKEFQVEAYIVPDRGKAEVHTLRFELSDPSGKVRKEYSSWGRTLQGKAVWQWNVPCNAARGKWVLKVSETISGISRKIQLDVTF
ncbi:MAG: hypothetical protein E7048_11635 [Lentisphaerae bacterium]|nr:hypothetical protein [Lentisphaerota bacterium]